MQCLPPPHVSKKKWVLILSPKKNKKKHQKQKKKTEEKIGNHFNSSPICTQRKQGIKHRPLKKKLTVWLKAIIPHTHKGRIKFMKTSLKHFAAKNWIWSSFYAPLHVGATELGLHLYREQCQLLLQSSSQTQSRQVSFFSCTINYPLKSQNNYFSYSWKIIKITHIYAVRSRA